MKMMIGIMTSMMKMMNRVQVMIAMKTKTKIMMTVEDAMALKEDDMVQKKKMTGMKIKEVVGHIVTKMTTIMEADAAEARVQGVVSRPWIGMKFAG
jgi:hypothetical protein